MRKAPALALAVALVAGLAHATSLEGTYTFDDHAIVEENPRLAVHDLAGVRALLASNYWGASAGGERLWRPVPLATYALERAAAGRPDARLAHAVNVALHALASVLALALFATLVRPRAALLGALLFAAHPLHAEAVAGIVGRAEVLALVFGLLALLLHVRGRGVLARAGEALALGLALGSKESAVAAVPIAVVLDLVLEGRVKPARLVAPLGALVLYVLARASVLGALVALPGGRTLGDKTLLERLPYTFGVLRDAWLDVLWPVHGTSAHFPLPDTSDRGLFLAGAVQGAVLALALGSLVLARRERPGSALGGVAVGLASVELALVPVSNLVPIGVVYAERLLYAPTLWACLLAGALAGRLTRGRGALAAAALVGGLVLLSSRNDRAWSDDVAMWAASVARFPEQPRAHLGYAEALLNRRTGLRDRDRENRDLALASARFAAERFEETQPLKAKAHVILAHALLAARPGQPAARAEAERALGRALELDARSVDAWLALAQLGVESDAPDWPRVLVAARRACEAAPASYLARWRLGFALWKSGDLAGARRVLDESLALDPSPGEALFYRAEVSWQQGARDEATRDYVGAAEALVAKGRRGEARAVLAPRLAELPPEARERIVALLERGP